MLKELRYTGYTASPSDYDCPDGQLALALNLINEDGSLRPLFPPRRLLSLPASQEVVYCHRTSAFTHYLVHDSASLSLQWLDPDSQNAVDLGIFPSVMQVQSLGNTLIVLTPAGMHYFLWKPDLQDYADLGTGIPFPEISFALAFAPVSSGEDSFTVALDIPDGIEAEVSESWFERSGSGASRPHPSASHYKSPEYKALISDATTAVLAGLNKYVADAADECLFTEPFFVRYALRLYDGSHVMHSAPVLMIPNSAGPVLPYTPKLDGNSFSATTSIIHSRCSLLFRILKADLDAWADIVTHVDFFVSAPVYTFDQAGQVNPGLASVTAAEGKFSHAGHGGAHVNTSRADPVSGADILFIAGNRETPLAVPSGMEWNIGRRTATEIAGTLVSQQASLYYLVSSVEVGKIAVMEAFSPLDMQDMSLRNLITRTRLDDDYQSHHTLIPSLGYVYNSRLNIAGIIMRPFGGFPLRSMSQAVVAPSGHAEGSVSCRVWVCLRKNGTSMWVSTGEEDLPMTLGEDWFPRWLFYPDSSAVEMLIAEYSGGELTGWWRIPLTTHDFLEGAYWLRSLGSELPDHIVFSGTEEPGPGKIFFDAPSAECNQNAEATGLDMPSKLYTSEVGNPFFFPVTGINTIGAGRIIGLASAARALSQGQFGQFPLYALTDEGVWALEVSATGGFTAKQPVTRDVCLSAHSITQIDSAVLFATERGIMLLAGSQTQCITDPINNKEEINFTSLPAFHHLLSYAQATSAKEAPSDCGASETSAPPASPLAKWGASIAPFSEFLKGCRMAYDYINQRIILFNERMPYAYVYSLRSKLWGMQESTLHTVVDAYPSALAMAKDEEDQTWLVDLSHTDATSTICLLVTRPIKFDAPDVLKTVTTAIQRGILPHRKVAATALYATRDYLSWHYVASWRRLRIEQIRGTPFRAFRLASILELSPWHSLSGCSFDITPRFTRRLR